MKAKRSNEKLKVPTHKLSSITCKGPIVPNANELAPQTFSPRVIEFSKAHRANLPGLIRPLRQEGDFEIRINRERAKVISVLGRGGSKKVYDVELGNERLALAVPNTDVDNATTIYPKWIKALDEPSHTAIIRDLGLCTNPLSQVVVASVDQKDFPAIIMKRYADLPYKVIDSKNRYSSTQKKPVLPEGGLNIESFISIFTPVIEDCATLLKNKILLGSDCFNICVDESGKLRLYLNDLGAGMQISEKELSKSAARDHCDYYVASAMDAWASVFNFHELDEHKLFFKEFDKRRDDPTSITARLREKVLEKL